jgi:uncharacterized protein (DUF1501 family)
LNTTRRKHFMQANHLITDLSNLLNTKPWLPGLTFSAENQKSSGDILVCIFQRGAMDGLNVVVPVGDPDYYKARPTIAISQPVTGNEKTAIALDSYFGLHPSLKDLKPIWDTGALSAVHASGSLDPTHSHFDAQNFMECGTPGEKQTGNGWLSRHIQTAPWKNSSPFRSLSIGTMVPMSLQGANSSIAIRSLPEFRLSGKNGSASVVEKLSHQIQEMYAGEGMLDQRARLTFEAIQALQKITPGAYIPAKGVKYPESDFGQGLKQIAQLVKADIGLEIATLDIGGWDTHILEGGADGQMARLLADFGAGLAAFYLDLQEVFQRVTLISMSEFGRRVQENGNGGTDHGHGNVMFIMSQHLASPKIYGTWPGLAKEKLYGPGDLAVTTDYRQVLSELTQNRLMNPKISEVFPGFQPGTPLGLFKSS